MLYTLVFIVIANIDVMVTESTTLAQVEDLVASNSAEGSAPVNQVLWSLSSSLLLQRLPQ